MVRQPHRIGFHRFLRSPHVLTLTRTTPRHWAYLTADHPWSEIQQKTPLPALRTKLSATHNRWRTDHPAFTSGLALLLVVTHATRTLFR
jgi:hypothetical protein